MTKRSPGLTHTKSIKHVVPVLSRPGTPLMTPTPTDSPPTPAAPAPVAAPNTTAASPTPSTLVDTPPDGAIPAPPAGFVEASPKQFQGFRPKAGQVAVAATVATELETAVGYAAEFGSAAPDQTAFASAVDRAQRWRAIRTATEGFLAYARTEDGEAWKNALTMVTQIEPLFNAALARDATVAERYPALSRMLSIPRAIAQVAVATRKKEAKAKTTNAAPPATPAAPVPPTPAASGTTLSAPAAADATPPRVVTVTG
jgi:hypothetical protein